MDYEKIYALIESNNLNVDKFAKSIKMSGTGLKNMILNKSCSVNTLELICKTYKLPITYFFSRSDKYNLIPAATSINNECKECIKKDAIIELLQEQNHEKEEIISSLNQNIGSLKAQLKNNGNGNNGYTNSKAG